MRELTRGCRDSRVPGHAAALALAAAVFASAAGGQPAPRDAWAQLRLPDSMQVFDAGSDVVLNGMPMQLQGFVSPEPVSRLVPALQRSLGEPLMINRLGDKVVLGRAEGGRYLTIQVEPAGSGSRGAMAITDLQGTQAGRAETELERREWAERLPSGSSVHSFMKSRDGLQQSRQLVYSNRHGEMFNRDRLQALLEHQGLRLEQERVLDGDADAARGMAPVSGRVLFFRGAGRNGIATINQEQDGRFFVVLNLVSTLESYP